MKWAVIKTLPQTNSEDNSSQVNHFPKIYHLKLLSLLLVQLIHYEFTTTLCPMSLLTLSLKTYEAFARKQK